MYLFKLVSSPKPRSGLAGSYGNSSFSFLRKLQIIFHQLDLSFMSQDDMVCVLHAQHWFNAPGLHEDCGFHMVAGTSSPAAQSPLLKTCVHHCSGQRHPSCRISGQGPRSLGRGTPETIQSPVSLQGSEGITLGVWIQSGPLKESTCQHRRLRFDPWSGKIP